KTCGSSAADSSRTPMHSVWAPSPNPCRSWSGADPDQTTPASWIRHPGRARRRATGSNLKTILKGTIPLTATGTSVIPRGDQMDFHALNALLNLYDDDGKIQFDKDREAANQYFLQHVNQNTVFFDDLEEKIEYLVENKYYEPEVIEDYDWKLIKCMFKREYSFKF